MYIRSCSNCRIPRSITCDQALFSFRSVKHAGGKGETKNRAWYNSSTERWLTFNKTANQNLLCLHAPRYANFPYVYVMTFAKSPQMSAKIRKSQATINLGTSVQIYNLKARAPVLYIVKHSHRKQLPWHGKLSYGRIPATARAIGV